MSWPSQMTPATGRPRVASLPAAALLLTPAVLLAVSAMRLQGLPRSVAVGIAVTIALEGLFLLARYGSSRATASVFLVSFYAVAAVVLRFNSPDLSSAHTHVLLAASILLPVLLFVRREIAATIGTSRQARFLIRQILVRQVWPESYGDYPEDPMIRELRAALGNDAGPVLPLLAHDDVRVQLAALSALKTFPTWHRDQAETVLQRAQYSDDPAVRAAAVLALANVQKPRHVLALLPFMLDPSEQVRRAAAGAVLWDAPRRWPAVRGHVRAALGASYAEKDGPLPCSALFPPEVLDDLAGWSGEAGAIGKRATETVIRHCKKAITEDGSSSAIARVTALVESPKVSPALRVELAHRLQSADAFPPDVAVRVLGPSQPTMLRLLAAGAVLAEWRDPRAVDVLREAGRQPNREIALAAARMIQRYLSVDMGLPVGNERVSANSREAAEVARRVLRWASESSSQATAETPSDAAASVPKPAYF